MIDIIRENNIILTFSNDKFKNQLFNFLSNLSYEDVDKIYVYFHNLNINDISHYKKISSKIEFVHIIVDQFDLQTYSSPKSRQEAREKLYSPSMTYEGFHNWLTASCTDNKKIKKFKSEDEDEN